MPHILCFKHNLAFLSSLWLLSFFRAFLSVYLAARNNITFPSYINIISLSTNLRNLHRSPVLALGILTPVRVPRLQCLCMHCRGKAGFNWPKAQSWGKALVFKISQSKIFYRAVNLPSRTPQQAILRCQIEVAQG